MAAAPKSVASAANLEVEPTDEFVRVEGTTTITSINLTSTAGARAAEGQRLTLIFSGVLTVTDGSNLKIAGNFVTSADDTMELVYTGGSWYELGRSAN